MFFHDEPHDAYPNADHLDRCPACDSGYVGAHGAYACGYPNADCPVMVAEMEEAAEVDEFWTAGDGEEPSSDPLAGMWAYIHRERRFAAEALGRAGL